MAPPILEVFMKACRFYSDPGRIVNDGISGRRLFTFDEKGEYTTLDPVLANRMKTYFRYEEIELIEKGKEEPKDETKEEKPEIKVYHCKFPGCTFETENRGKLLAHSKTHKEG
jgi:hypothetical protein